MVELDNKRIRDQLAGETDEVLSINKWKNEQISIYDSSLEIESTSYSTSTMLVWDHSSSSHGVWDSCKWAGDSWESYTTFQSMTDNQKLPWVALKEFVTWLKPLDSGNAPTHIALGTDSTAFNQNDTSLGVESFRVDYSDYGSKDNSTSKQAVFTIEFTDKNNQNLVEVGLFNDASGGTLFSRRTFNELDLSSTKQYKFTWTFKFEDV